MAKKLNRRTFIKKSTGLGFSALIGSSLLPRICKGVSIGAIASSKLDIGVVKGENYFNNTVEAIKLLGGMKKFVPKNSKTGILINSSFKNPGTYVNPAIVLAAVSMCNAAGAKEIILLHKTSGEYWSRSRLSKKYKEEIRSLKSVSGVHVKIPVKNGKTLKEVRVVKELMECDVFINIPVTKDHTGTRFTGTMKNMMGSTSRDTNKFFHFGSNAKGAYDDVDFLSQCIADLNMIRRPDLCITDATEFVTTNGPFGPGKIIKPQKVVAGVDGIAVDSYSATLLGLGGSDVIMIKKGYECGLGEINLNKLKIKELAL